jgi:hypothetical protein
MLSDTTDQAERVWIELWRQKSPAFRLQRALALSAEVIARSRAAIARAVPVWSKQQCDLFWVEVHYGRDLADRLREHLKHHG